MAWLWQREAGTPSLIFGLEIKKKDERKKERRKKTKKKKKNMSTQFSPSSFASYVNCAFLLALFISIYLSVPLCFVVLLE
jgi:hypothetical protein